jgi:hypothetical protein
MMYLQVRTSKSIDAVRKTLEAVAPVVAAGVGTAADPAAYWFELEFDAHEAAQGVYDRVSARLDQPQNPAFSIQRLQPIVRGAGASLARQFDLFAGGP